MKPVGTWAAIALTLTFAATAQAQTAPAQAVPAQDVPAQAAPAQPVPVQAAPAGTAPMQPAAQPQAIPCNPACAANQVCASNGQCLQLVQVAPAYAAPAYAAPAQLEFPPAKRRNSTGMMVGGIVMAGVGGVSALTGLLYMSIADIGCTDSSSSYDTTSCEDSADTMRTMGVVMAVGGAIVAVAGIPLIAIGARKVPVNNVESAAASTIRRLPEAELVLVPQGLSLRGTF